MPVVQVFQYIGGFKVVSGDLNQYRGQKIHDRQFGLILKVKIEKQYDVGLSESFKKRVNYSG